MFPVWGITRKGSCQDLGANSVKLGNLISAHLSLMREKDPLFQPFELLRENQVAIQRQQGLGFVYK